MHGDGAAVGAGTDHDAALAGVVEDEHGAFLDGGEEDALEAEVVVDGEAAAVMGGVEGEEGGAVGGGEGEGAGDGAAR